QCFYLKVIMYLHRNALRLTRRSFGFLTFFALNLGIRGWSTQLKAGESGAGKEKMGESIMELGGEIERDESHPLKPVVVVNFAQTRITDSDLGCLERLTEIRKLRLEDTLVTDAGMARLSELVKLESLNLFRDVVS